MSLAHYLVPHDELGKCINGILGIPDLNGMQPMDYSAFDTRDNHR
jgi:hypothetical protein